MRKLLSLILLFTFALLLVGCKKDQGGGTTGEGEIIDFSEQYGEKETIRVWIDDESGEYMQAIIKEFNKVYPNIFVQHVHKGSVDSREHLKTFGPSGNGADVFQFPHDHLAAAILEDLVLPLPSATRDYVESVSHQLGVDIATLSYDESLGSFDPSSPNAEERLFAVPMSIEAVGLYYNKDLVATPAETYEELLAAGAVWNAAIPADGDGTRTNAQLGHYYLGTSSHWADSYFIQHIYSAFDFTPFGPQLNNPASVGFVDLENALTWMRDEFKPIVTGAGATDSVAGGQLFEEGKIPYVIAGPWNHEAYKNAGLNYGVAKLPSINGKETQPFAGAMMAAVYKYSNNKSAAIAFVEFLSSDVAMELQYQFKGKLPALKADRLSHIDGLSEDEHLMVMAAQLETAVPMPTIPEVQYYWGPGEAMVKEIWNNDKNILESLQAAEEGYLSGKAVAGR